MKRIKWLLLGALLLALVACSSGIEDVPELEAAGAIKRTSVKVYYDAEEKSNGQMVVPSTDLELAYDRGSQTVGLQFDKLNVPQGAVVKNAYIQFKADETDSGRAKLRIRGEATNDADIYRGNKRNISRRSTTSASVTWQPKAWKKRGERGRDQRTPNLAPIVQEVVNRDGWRSGNALGIMISGNGKGKRVAESSNGDRPNRPMLVVEYRLDENEPQPTEPAAPRGDAGGVPIILDTDYGFDVDDVGALAVLHALADNGEAKILATISVVRDPHTPGAMDAVNTYYGRKDLPLGQNHYAPRSYKWDKAYPYWRDSSHFVKYLDREFPHDSSANVPSAVDTYRKVLAQQPDRSVTIVVVGFMKNMTDLMNSQPDRYSNLSGMNLIKRKVKKLVIMGGSYPGQTSDFNLTNGPARTAKDGQEVINRWPTELVFTGGELCYQVYTGRTLQKMPNARKNPVARAYKLFKSSYGRSSWDLCSVLYAVRGNKYQGKTYFGVDASHRLILKDNLDHYWVRGGRKNQKRLTPAMSIKGLERTLEALLTQPPKNR